MPRKHNNEIKKIIVILWMNGAAGRDILTGVFQAARAERHWSIRLLQLPDRFTTETVRAFADQGIDGIITSEFGDSAMEEALANLDIPLVFIGPRSGRMSVRKKAFTAIGCNDRQIGALGAAHFMSLGEFRSYAFLGAPSGVQWSGSRAEGFRSHLAERGIACDVFTPGTHERHWDLDRQKLAEWVAELPKPAAVMAAFDYYAIQLLDACRTAGIQVPDQVSVLGVDNDELLCDFSDPPLSSICPDHTRAGLLAAMELAKLIRSPTRTPRTITCPISGIAERDSTRPISPSANLIRRGLDFIERNAHRGIDVTDVVAYLRVSRRLADLRFSQIEGKSILSTILGRRLQIAEKLLRETDKPIRRIAAESGFNSIKTFEAAFRRSHGESARSWRQGRDTGNA